MKQICKDVNCSINDSIKENLKPLTNKLNNNQSKINSSRNCNQINNSLKENNFINKTVDELQRYECSKKTKDYQKENEFTFIQYKQNYNNCSTFDYISKDSERAEQNSTNNLQKDCRNHWINNNKINNIDIQDNYNNKRSINNNR